MYPGTLPLLALLPAFFGHATAQAPGAGGGPGVPMDPSQWPEWIENDYKCVINCLSGFNDQVTSIPQSDMEKEAVSCASANCEGDGTGNYYQTYYYIQLYYATGSIYEWAESAPDGYKKATFTDASAPAAQESASDIIATASEPWEVTGDSQPPPTDAASASGSGDGSAPASGTGSADSGATNPAMSPGATATDSNAAASGTSHASSAKSGASSAASATGTGAKNGTDGSNGSSGALQTVFIGLGPGVQGMLSIALGAVVSTVGAVWIGL